MSRKLLIFGLVLVTAFNVVAISTFAYLHFNRPEPPDTPGAHLFERMHLDDRHFEALRESRREFIENIEPYRDSIMTLRVSLFDEMIKDDPDVEIVDSLVGAIGEIQTEIHRTAIANMMEYGKTLPKEMRERMLRMFDRHSAAQFEKRGRWRDDGTPPHTGRRMGEGRRPWMKDTIQTKDSVDAR